MSWTAAAFGLVLLALAGGFAWWERSRPPARLLALVATLAALAVAGRIAFAPIPNVKPTTDIVLLAGFALGAAPGFATGAVAALASNVFFGQGPWTPWQMLAWGLVGLLGAGVAAVAGRGLGRVPLAVACAVAALLFGVVMDVYQWLTFQSVHDVRTYGAVAATSLPFNLAHVIASIVFCLAFGPALAAALLRFRARLDVRWLPVAATVVAAGALAGPTDADAAAPKASIGYLIKAQNRDGGFGGAPGQTSTGLHSGWAAIGLAAAGRNPQDVKRPGGTSLASYLASSHASTSDVGAVERTILARVASGESVKRLVASLERRQSANGAVSGRVNTTSYAVLAFRAAGADAAGVRRGTAWVARQQNRDGGFSFAKRGAASGVDDTAGAVQALVAGGRAGTPAVARAVRFLLRQQRPDGGFPLQPGGPSNAQSTAFAVQGLVAAGRSPRRVRRDGSRTPVAYLRSLTQGDGAVRYSRTSAQTPVWVTSQVVAALEQRPLPIARVARAATVVPKAVAATPTPTPTATGAPRSAEREHAGADPGAQAPKGDAPRLDAAAFGAAVARVVHLLAG